MNTPEKVGSLLSAAGFTLGRVWLEPLEYQWDVPRFTCLRTRFGATKRELDTLDPRAREACLDRIEARMSCLNSKDLVCRATAICAMAATYPGGGAMSYQFGLCSSVPSRVRASSHSRGARPW